MISTEDPTTSAAFWSQPTSVPSTTDGATDHDDDDEIRLPVAVKAVLGIGLLLIVLLATIGNGVVCFIVFQKPSMRSAINLLLANMALSSILLTITVMPLAFVTLLTDRWAMGDAVCRLAGFLQSAFVCEVIVMLLAITTDRYMIIVTKNDRLTPIRAKYAIAVTWFLSFALTFPPLVGWGSYGSYRGWMMCVLEEYRDADQLVYAVLHYTVLFFLPIVTLGYLFGTIVWTVHQHSRRIHNHPDELAAPAVKLGLVLPAPSRISANFNGKMRAFKTIFLLCVLFVVCWTPYAVSMTVWNSRHRISDNYLPGTILIWTGYLNCALDPLIYCWRIGKFREACRSLIPRALREVPRCPNRVRRRVNPGSIYEQRDNQAMQLQELQVQSYLTIQPPSTCA